MQAPFVQIKSITQRITKRLAVYSFLAVPASIIGFAGSYYWIFDLFSHFRVQYCVLFFIGLISSLKSKYLKTAAVFAAAISLNAIPLFPSPGSFTASKDTTESKSFFRVLLFNLSSNNSALDELKEFIRNQRPNFLVLLENGESSTDFLKLKTLGYEHSLIKNREDNFGIALFSKHSFNGSLISLNDGDIPSIAAAIDLGGHEVQLLATHPPPPISEQYTEYRNRQIQNAAKFISSYVKNDIPAIALGDFNTTPWSWIYRNFLDSSKLYDTRPGYGIQASWPSNLPLLWIPIDHIFVSSRIKVVNRWIGPDLGSDHYPVLMDFSIRHSRKAQ